MKAFIAIQLLAILLAAATAYDTMDDTRHVEKDGASKDVTAASSASKDVTAPFATTAATWMGNSKKITNFRQVKLTPRNMIPESNGVPYAIGIAAVQLDYDPSRMNKWRVCIQANVIGFMPDGIHINSGKITENGMAEVDFTDSLNDDTVFDDCVTADQALFIDIRDHPVRGRWSLPTIILELLSRFKKCC